MNYITSQNPNIVLWGGSKPCGKMNPSRTQYECLRKGVGIGKRIGIQKGLDMAESTFRQRINNNTRRSANAGNAIGALMERRNRPVEQVQVQIPVINIDTLSQLRAKQLVQLKRNQASPVDRRRMTREYGPTNRMTLQRAREFLRNEGLPNLIAGEGSFSDFDIQNVNYSLTGQIPFKGKGRNQNQNGSVVYASTIYRNDPDYSGISQRFFNGWNSVNPVV